MRFLLLALLMAPCGCSPSAQDDYFPLAVGNEWVMDNTSVTSDGHRSEGIYHRKIEGVVEKDGRTYFRFRMWQEGAQSEWNSTKLIRKDEKGVYFMDELNGVTAEQVEFLLQLKVGATWNRTTGGKTLSESVVEMQTIKVSDQTYKDCFHIRGADENGIYSEDQWVGPNIGEVKARHGRPGLTFTQTLMEFIPAEVAKGTK